MKSADSLDVARLGRPDQDDPSDRDIGAATQQSRLHLHTQKIIKNDRCRLSRLSKIAHIHGLRLRGRDWHERGARSYADGEFQVPSILRSLPAFASSIGIEEIE
jgi:hypothetical protein